ncbi:cytochrome c biogenesis protein CcsA [Shigella flexneri]
MLPNFPIEGRDLNPPLQDPGPILHPPLLYMGYVGFSGVCFCDCFFVVRASGQHVCAFYSSVDVAAWISLTLGIVLVPHGPLRTGWGGWWFWDPVNASVYAVAGGDCADALTGGH